jgi:hypothetical protein
MNGSGSCTETVGPHGFGFGISGAGISAQQKVDANIIVQNKIMTDPLTSEMTPPKTDEINRRKRF